MATKRWSNKLGRYITVENSERKRKSDLIQAAVVGRGLRPTANYRDGTILTVGGGQWEVDLEWPRGPFTTRDGKKIPAYFPPIYGSVREDTFEDLLARFTDDILYAQHIYQHCEAHKRLASALQQAQSALSEAFKQYGYAEVRLLRAALDKEGDSTFMANAIDSAGAQDRATKAHAAEKQARAAYDAYMKGMPQDEEQARKYLAIVAPAPLYGAEEE